MHAGATDVDCLVHAREWPPAAHHSQVLRARQHGQPAHAEQQQRHGRLINAHDSQQQWLNTGNIILILIAATASPTTRTRGILRPLHGRLHTSLKIDSGLLRPRLAIETICLANKQQILHKSIAHSPPSSLFRHKGRHTRPAARPVPANGRHPPRFLHISTSAQAVERFRARSTFLCQREPRWLEKRQGAPVKAGTCRSIRRTSSHVQKQPQPAFGPRNTRHTIRTGSRPPATQVERVHRLGRRKQSSEHKVQPDKGIHPK